MSLEPSPSGSQSPGAILQLAREQHKLLAFVERRVKSRVVAEDILQTAFTRALERIDQVEQDKVVAWFYRVLRNLIIDHYRQQSASERALETFARDLEIFDKSAPELRGEICQCVSRLFVTLKPEYRDAMQIMDIGEGKLADIAQQSGITAENAAVRVHRARKALRNRVEQACGKCAERGCLDCDCQS